MAEQPEKHEPEEQMVEELEGQTAEQPEEKATVVHHHHRTHHHLSMEEPEEGTCQDDNGKSKS
jgi:hypothetical protein